MKTFLFSALVVAAVEAGNNLKYATVTPYTGPSCKTQTPPAETVIMVMDLCVNSDVTTGTSYELTMNAGKITYTTYSATNCTGDPQVAFSAAPNKCGNYTNTAGGQSAIFTAADQSFDQSCSLKYPPYTVTYQGDSCLPGAVVTMVTGQTSECDTVGKTSVQNKCDNGTIVQCTYTQANCKGKSTCTPGEEANQCKHWPSGNSQMSVCPGGTGNVPSVCPAHSPNKKPAQKDIGGIVAGVVVVIVIVIIVVVVLAVFFIKKTKGSADDSGLMDGSETTYGSA